MTKSYLFKEDDGSEVMIEIHEFDSETHVTPSTFGIAVIGIVVLALCVAILWRVW